MRGSSPSFSPHAHEVGWRPHRPAVLSAFEPFILDRPAPPGLHRGQIAGAIRGGEENRAAPKLGLSVLLLQGLATSVDALSVGFTIASYGTFMAIGASLVIALVTFLICLGGVLIGKRFGIRLARKAGFLGGGILLFIGLRFLCRASCRALNIPSVSFPGAVTMAYVRRVRRIRDRAMCPSATITTTRCTPVMWVHYPGHHQQLCAPAVRHLSGSSGPWIACTCWVTVFWSAVAGRPAGPMWTDRLPRASRAHVFAAAARGMALLPGRAALTGF